MYQGAYKCRLCGESFCDEKIKGEGLEDFRVTNILSQMQQTLISGNPNNADLHIFYKCKNGSIGFCDFQGFEKVED